MKKFKQTPSATASSLTLEVAIVTFGIDGGRRIEAMNLPQLSDVSYLVSWQDGGDYFIPESIVRRKDIRIVKLPGRGVGRNRNNVLDHAVGDIVMIGDDDIKYYPDAICRVLQIFRERPELEYASFQYDSDVPKYYPEGEQPLRKLPKNFYQTSFEIAIRRNSRAGNLRFHEKFGLQAEKYTAGEEDLFLKRARCQGIDCRMIPLKIAFHPGPTTGVKIPLADGAILTRGVLTAIEFPWTAALRVILGAYRIQRNGQASFVRALRLMSAGALHGYFDKETKKYLKDPL